MADQGKIKTLDTCSEFLITKEFDTQCKTMENSDKDEENSSWLDKFTSLMCSVVANTNYELFENLLTTYEENMSRDIFKLSNSSKPFSFSKSIKLRKHIRNTLNFFHFYWRNLKKRVSDHYSYLDKMAKIVGLYLHLELVTNSRNIDSATILTALCIYLDNSKEYIFKILLKSRYVTKSFSRIYCPIFAKLLSNAKSSTESIQDFTYIRYLLAFKLWKTLVDSLDEKKRITDMALMKLGSSVPKMGAEFSKFIPQPPDGQGSGTLWLMESNSIDLRDACDGFLMLEEKSHSSPLDEELNDSQLDMENNLQLRLDPDVEQTSKMESIPKKVQRSLLKLKPGGEVLFIDLTSDDEEAKLTNDKKQKTKKKPQWLKEMKVNHKFKKPQPFHKSRKWVEVANARSTESSENFEKTRPEKASPPKTAYCLDKRSVYCSVEEDVVSSQTPEDEANQKISSETRLTNTCQKCNRTSNTKQKTNTNETCPDLVNKINTLIENSIQMSNLRRDIVHSYTTYLTSVCDNIRPSVLHNESRDIFDYTAETICSESGKKLPSDWDNRSDKADVCPVSTTVGDQISESSSGVWTDYNSADSEAPDTLASPRSEIYLNSCKTQQEEVLSTTVYEPQEKTSRVSDTLAFLPSEISFESCKIHREEVGEKSKLDGSLTTSFDPQTPEKIIDVCLSEIVVKTTPKKLDSILSEEIGMEKEYQNFVESFPSDSLLEGSIGTTGILNSLLDFDLMGLDSSSTEFSYSNVQAIDPNLITKPPDADDFKISVHLGESPPENFINGEMFEEKEEPGRVDISAELTKCQDNTNEWPKEVIETPRKKRARMKNEVSCTSRKISEDQLFNSEHKRNSTVWRSSREASEPTKKTKRSRRSHSSLSDSEEPFRKKERVQELLPFKKRQEARSHTYLREVVQGKSLSVVKKDAMQERRGV